MRAHRDPDQLRAVGAASARLGRCAGEAAEDLLDALPMLGDHATQRAVDEAVESLVDALRGVEVDAQEVAFALGSLAGAPADAAGVEQDAPGRVRS